MVRIYRLRHLGGTVGTAYVKLRLPQDLYGDRFPKFRQIFIQNTNAAGGSDLQVKFSEDADSQWTIPPRVNPLNINVSEDEGIEVEQLLLRGLTAATTYEIILMYDISNDP